MTTEPRAPSEETQDHKRDLLASLFRELLLAERAAVRFPRREAERFGNAPPAQALRAVAEHAETSLAKARTVARRHDLRVSRVGVMLGMLASRMRHSVSDRMVDTERSYRDILLGMRHGLDVVKLIRRIADTSGMVELGGFCTRWLEEREPMVERVESAMGWFAEHPTRAAETHRLPRLRRRGREARPGSRAQAPSS